MRVLVLAVLLLAGCATAYKLNDVSVGMEKVGVVDRLGPPAATSAAGSVEVLHYWFHERGSFWDVYFGYRTAYFVRLVDGKVVEFGREIRHPVKAKPVVSGAIQPDRIKEDVYGPGIHQDQFGRPVVVRPMAGLE